jgi:uncharacterized repeat protein (TIGR03806 family)
MKKVGFLLLFWLILIACQKTKEYPFPQKLSEWNFFKDMKNLIPNNKVYPYDVITPLFTDYAEKARFVYIPESGKVFYNDTSYFDFTDGCVLIKNFYYFHHNQKKIIETRLLYKKNGSWIPLTYQWNENQTDAELLLAGNDLSVSFTNNEGQTQTIQYHIPNLNQCKSCHENQGVIQPIGIKAKHLNRNYLYSTGEENQLVYWTKNHFLEGLPVERESIPKLVNYLDTTEKLNDRARSWLDINCAHCHNPKGPAATSGLFLHSEETNPVHLGIMKSPVAAGKGTGGFEYDIVPGKPHQSILYYRLQTNEPGEKMPELGRTIVHKESLQLIEQWIKSLGATKL